MAARDGRAEVPVKGMTVVFEPDSPSLDIVFVHGFTGHPERTWMHKKGHGLPQRDPDNNGGEPSGPPQKARKFNPFSRPSNKTDVRQIPVYWPRDLLPTTMPDARVLTYGYDTHLRHAFGTPINRSTVYEMAWDFLVQLEAVRREDHSRPVLFVAHSLGGIMVKEALRRSAGHKIQETGLGLRHVFTSTIGLMFFGTPHGGADPRGFLQRIAERIIRAAGVSVNDHVINTLLPPSERLRELRDEFNPIIQDQDWIVYSFQEEIGVSALNNEKVVDDHSSYLGLPRIETTQHISRNHMEMCRFQGVEDIEYKKVAAAFTRIGKVLHGLLKEAPKVTLTEEDKKTLLETLRFEQIDTHQMSIRAASPKTCLWILKSQQYLDWLDVNKISAHGGFLWLRGKPGTGKSTLMKFLLHQARKSMEAETIISFFFKARGAELEKSTIGMYRSLLVQLFEQLPYLQRTFESVGFTSWNINKRHTWAIEPLKDLFREAILSLGQAQVTCFIDALDECDEDQIRDMVALFQNTRSQALSISCRFRVFFSSRHYPEIRLNTGLSLILDSQDGHTRDIQTYVDDMLRLGHTRSAESIKYELLRKSSGVFLWVVLVVDILNKENDRGKPPPQLQQILRQIPGNLHELFQSILTRDCVDRNELLLCLQWVLFARQPLQPQQLYYAILAGTDPESLSPWNRHETTLDDMKRFISNSSKGLTETTRSKTPMVQFIHESVRDFLLKEDGLREIWSDTVYGIQAVSHERLKQCCVNYLRIDFTIPPDTPSVPTSTSESRSAPESPSTPTSPPTPASPPTPGAPLLRSALEYEGTSIIEPSLTTKSATLNSKPPVTERFPFLSYVVENTLWHADAAQRSGLDQADSLQVFPRAIWLSQLESIERCKIHKMSVHASLAYILVALDLPNLIKSFKAKEVFLFSEQERYGSPLLASLAMQHHASRDAILEGLEEYQEPYGWSSRQWSSQNKRMRISPDFIFMREKSVFAYVAEQGDEILMRLFLNVDNSVYTSWYSEQEISAEGRTALRLACKNGHQDVVKLLLARERDAPKTDLQGRSPLSYAAGMGHEDIVKMLLAENHDPNHKDWKNWAALDYTVVNGHVGVTKILLEFGAERSFDVLHRAIARGHADIVEMLLGFESPLTALCGGKTETTSRMYLDHGFGGLLEAAPDRDSHTDQVLDGHLPPSLLHSAVQHGHEKITRVLLKYGAHVDDQSLSKAIDVGLPKILRMLLAQRRADAGPAEIGPALLFQAVDCALHSETGSGWRKRENLRGMYGALFENGARADAKDPEGRTALRRAVESYNLPAVESLLATGHVDINSRDENGQTALDWVITASDSPSTLLDWAPFRNILFEHGATVDKKHSTR